MKKLFLVLTFILIFSLAGCRGQSYGILSYQEKNIEAQCTLNGEYKILVTKTEKKSSVCFLEPSSLAHFSFTLSENGLTAKADDMEIPLNGDSASGVSALLSMFSLSEECLVRASQENGGDVFEFSSDRGEYRLTMGEAGVPKRIEISNTDFSFDIVVDAVKLN